jgi:hypothetical protein
MRTIFSGKRHRPLRRPVFVSVGRKGRHAEYWRYDTREERDRLGFSWPRCGHQDLYRVNVYPKLAPHRHQSPL